MNDPITVERNEDQPTGAQRLLEEAEVNEWGGGELILDAGLGSGI